MLNLSKILFSLLLFGAMLTAPAAELAHILKAGKLRVAVMDTASPPFMTLNKQKEYQGFEFDLISECAGTMGVKLELVPVDSYDGLVTALTEDKADVAMSQLSRTNKRTLKADFTQPYAKLHYALLVNRQEMLLLQKNETLDSYLRHYDGPLMVERDSSHVSEAKTLFPKAKTIRFENLDEVKKLIETRKLMAYFSDQVTIRALMKNHTGSYVFYQRVILEDTTDNICIALQPNCPRLKFYLNCFLEEYQNRINSILRSAL